MTFLKAFAGAAVAFLVIDAVWIAFVVKPFYDREVGSLLRESPNLAAGAAFYLLYAAGIVLLAVNPALTTASMKTAAINGAVLGAVAYGTYTVTNYAVLKQWSMSLVVSDILWGTFLTAVAAVCGYFVGRL
ncbi:MAG: DUF2177 family protein [Gammaproteobacteria bacterium]|nr:DUF2177 family protein [Gammaproteobacteria bacterium]NND59807.1 DUF2177 family protein [Gammaproteobacteria bacterium]